MSEIGTFSPEQARALWMDYLQRQQLNPHLAENYPQRRPIVERTTRKLQGKLDGALATATAFADNPATAEMSIWRKNSSGNMEDSGDNVTVVNRFLHLGTFSAGTIVKAEWIDGEWQVYAADCEA